MKIIKKVFLAGVLTVASLGVQAELISNGSFENSPLTPNATDYIYPQGEYAEWVFGSGSGVINATGPSAWYGNDSPTGFDGNNYGFIQGLSILEQSFVLAEESKLTMNWMHSGRPSSGVGGAQSYQVKIDGVVRGLFNTVSNNSFSSNSISEIILSAGEHSLEFVGLVSTDSTAFIDAISLTGEVITPVPVSSSAALLMLSMAGFNFRRKAK